MDYVRVCDWVGLAGYFYIPGTDTCIKIGGEVRAEYLYLDASRSFAPTPFTTTTDAVGSFHGIYTPGKLRNTTGFFTRGKIEVDSRTQTAYGLLRAFVRYQSDTKSGDYNSITYNASPNEANSTYIDKAYITFAGFTAGRVQSFFDLYADNWNFEDIANSDQSTQVLAYTATFGGGFSATISAEDPGVRRDGIGTIAFGNTAVGPNAALVGPFVNGAAVGFQGQKLPDAVLQVAYSQAWGTLQLSAAYHDVNTVTTTALTGTTGYASATEAGWAVQAGVDIKLPMLAAGDEFFLEGAYQEGAYLYQDANSNMSQILSGFQHQDVDAIAVGNGPGSNSYHLDLGKGFSVLGAFQHYFTPQFHDVLFGSYEEVSYGAAKNIDWARGGLGDSSQYKIGNDFVFTPVHNLDFGLEVLYAKLNQTLAHEVGLAASPIPVGVKVNPDTFEVRLRVDRNF